MKPIKELLNLLLTNPSDGSNLSNGKVAATPQGPQNGKGSFEDVLARLASQTGNNNGSNPQTVTAPPPVNQAPAGQGGQTNPLSTGQASTVTSVSETTLAITETVKASTPEQLVQAEQALASLAVGLANLINVMSQLNQGETQQAQVTLKSLAGGQVSLSSIQSVLNSLQNFVQKLPAEQNPLALTPAQQTALLGQLFQQLIQNQQVFFGALPLGQGGTPANSQSGTVGTQQTAILQVNFSEIQAALTQQQGAQTSQVFINLESFKMSATFIQEGQGGTLQALPNNTQTLLNNLNQALANAQPNNTPAVTPANSLVSASSQNDLNQNFKNLVQLLMQSGVSQAVLATFMRQNQETQTTNTTPNQTNVVPPISGNNLTQATPSTVEIPPVNPAELTTASSNNTNVVQLHPTPVVNPPGIQTPISTLNSVTPNQTKNEFNTVPTQTGPVVNQPLPENQGLNSNKPEGQNQIIGQQNPPKANLNPTPTEPLTFLPLKTPINPLQVENVALNPHETASLTPNFKTTGENQPGLNPPKNAPVQPKATTNPPPAENAASNPRETALLTPISNSTVENQQVQNPTINVQVQPKTTLNIPPNQNLAPNTHETTGPASEATRPNTILPQAVTAPSSLKNNPQIQKPTTLLQAQSTTPVNQPVPEIIPLNSSEITTLNNKVALLNASALHIIEGSIGGNNNPTADLRVTLDQVLASLSATKLSSGQISTFGNPSVPINTTVLERQTPVLTTLLPTSVEVTAQTPTPQNTVPQTFTPLSQTQPGVITPSPAVNPAAQPILQTTVNTAPANQVSAVNNGVVVVPPGETNNLNNTPNPAINSSNTAGNVNPGPVSTMPLNNVVPLPQPTTLPVGLNASGTQALNSSTNVQAFTPVSLNQTLVPPPTSQTPIVPATAAVGEGVKTEIPVTTGPRNENFANPSTVAGTQPLSSVIPISPEAVAPTDTVLSTATGLGTLNILDKNTPNNSAVLEANTLLGLSSLSNQPGITHTTTPSSISNAPGGNFDAVNILNQISQQVAAQTSDARTVSRLNFQLIPESLGRVTVQIALVDQAVSARIFVTNPEVRENLQHHLVDLKSALNQAGLQIDQLQVQVQGGGSGNLLAQYYQYQQEGFGYRQPGSPIPTGVEVAQNLENVGDFVDASGRLSLVNLLA